MVALTGYLGNDPDLSTTAGGTCVMRLSLAVSDRRKVNGEWQDYTHWIPCTMMGTRADSVSRFLSKGSRVGIKGKLNYSSWKNKDGETRSRVEVFVEDIELLSKPKEGASNGKGDAARAAEQQFGVDMQPYSDDDIPF